MSYTKKLLAFVSIMALVLSALVVSEAASATEPKPEKTAAFTATPTCGTLTLTVTNSDTIGATWYYGIEAAVNNETVGSVLKQGPGSNSETITFVEDSYGGSVDVEVFVHASTEQDALPQGWALGEKRTITVNTDCGEKAPATNFTVESDCGSLTLTVTNNDAMPSKWQYGIEAKIDGTSIGGVTHQGPGENSIKIPLEEDSYGDSVEVDVSVNVHRTIGLNAIPDEWTKDGLKFKVNTYTIDTNCEDEPSVTEPPVTEPPVTEPPVEIIPPVSITAPPATTAPVKPEAPAAAPAAPVENQPTYTG